VGFFSASLHIQQCPPVSCFFFLFPAGILVLAPFSRFRGGGAPPPPAASLLVPACPHTAFLPVSPSLFRFPKYQGLQPHPQDAGSFFSLFFRWLFPDIKAHEAPRVNDGLLAQQLPLPASVPQPFPLPWTKQSLLNSHPVDLRHGFVPRPQNFTRLMRMVPFFRFSLFRRHFQRNAK